jgi:hypothetical protein
VPERIERLGANACAVRPRPFNLRDWRLVDGEYEPGDLSSGSYMRRSHEVDLVVGYGNMPQQQLTIEREIADDEELLERVLTWEPNIALTASWTGCRVVGSQLTDSGDVEGDSPPPVRLLVMTLEVSHREKRIV